MGHKLRCCTESIPWFLQQRQQSLTSLAERINQGLMCVHMHSITQTVKILTFMSNTDESQHALYTKTSSSSAFPAISLGSSFWVRFLRMWLFFFSINNRGSHIPSLWMVHAGCVFIGSIYPSRTYMSASFESVRRNTCAHRLDLDSYSHLKEFWGNGVRNHVNSKGKIPSTGGSEEVQTHYAASGRTASPTHYQLSYSDPVHQDVIWL